MKNFFCLSLVFINTISAQLVDSVRVNTSTTTTYNVKMTHQASNYFYTYRRGQGTSSSDRQIILSRSTNNGASFVENNITISGATST